MVICECPICETNIDLEGYGKYDIIECPDCGVSLELVSLRPPVLEAPFEENANEDDDDWDDFE